MNQPLPQLPKPEFVLIPVKVPPEVPTQVAVDLGKNGIPGGLIGYEYRALSEPVYFADLGERGLVGIAVSDLFGHIAIAVDVASGHVVETHTSEPAAIRHVNRDLDSFNRCVKAVIARFPFYAEGDEETDEVADELRGLISGIDETSLARNGFWETFCDDVQMGDYPDWDG
ncbi:SUKH-4 family immunity protein [Streptomyces sp. NPDC052494]|uniref:SUKH-4 family immunity protein n=1 Tax=Streptomyces sp. NPDC052494 TaxID=3365692 RepID=UPI0037D8F956